MTSAQEQAVERLITLSKTACEETRAKVGRNDDDPDSGIPSWLLELETAIIAVEDECNV